MSLFDSFWGGLVVGVIGGQLLALLVTAFLVGAYRREPAPAPRPAGQRLPSDIRRAVQAYQLAEMAYTDDMEQRGVLIAPELVVEAGLRAAAPYLLAVGPITSSASGLAPQEQLDGRC